MVPKLILLAFLLPFFGNPSQENTTYQREYYPSGTIKSAGWAQNGIKSAYWKFFHPNGKLSEEGHYRNGRRQKYWHFYTPIGTPQKEGHYRQGEMNDWWLFYDKAGKINHKCQLKNGKKNGYCLKYKNQKLTSAEKYDHGEKIDEWYSFSSFRRENNLSDLK